MSSWSMLSNAGRLHSRGTEWPIISKDSVITGFQTPALGTLVVRSFQGVSGISLAVSALSAWPLSL